MQFILKTMFREVIIKKHSKWLSMAGGRFDTYKYVEVIFYTLDDVKKCRPYFSYGARGAVIGGGTNNYNTVLDFINRHLAKDEKPLTMTELERAVGNFRRDVIRKKTDPIVYYSQDKDFVICPFCGRYTNIDLKTKRDGAVECDRCRKIYRIEFMG